MKPLKRITSTIEREWLLGIVTGTKKIEYRERKPYWDKRLENGKLPTPFELRLLNGMRRPVPEATVRIDKITRSAREYELHIGKILGVKHLPKSTNVKRRRPRSSR